MRTCAEAFITSQTSPDRGVFVNVRSGPVWSLGAESVRLR